jgi:hypothetical protein
MMVMSKSGAHVPKLTASEVSIANTRIVDERVMDLIESFWRGSALEALKSHGNT